MHPEVERMIPRLMEQAKALAWRYHTRAPHALDRDELESIAYTGLVTAANSWESYCERNSYSPDATNYFGAYASRRMRGAILDYMRGQDWLTRGQRVRAKALAEAGFETGASEDELTERTGYSRDQIRQVSMALAARPASFGDTGPPEIEGTQDVAAEVSASAILLVVTQVIASLSPEDQVVVCLRYYSGLEDSDIADATGLSRDGVKELLERSAVAVHEAMMRAVRG